jgi:simple sugar transport system ATP-binding protein
MVLRYVAAARDAGLGVVLITHNPHHAYLVGDRFVLLKRGTMSGSHLKEDITLDELTREMAGGSELDELTHELNRTRRGGTMATDAAPSAPSAEQAPETPKTPKPLPATDPADPADPETSA